MFIDCRDLTEPQSLSVDVCIVGAGAAGITLARDLIASGLRVCVLEAGGFALEDSDQSLSNAVNVGLPYRGLNQRGRAFGGSTHLWAGMCSPLAPEDFEEREWMALSGWPISRVDLDPFYKRAQRTCEVGGFEYDATALSERRGHPLLPLRPERVETTIYHNSPPTRFGTRYRADFEDIEEVTVYLYAALTEITLNEGGESGDQVERLEARVVEGDPEVTITVEARRFCLAMGGVENARHLMAYQSDAHPDGLGNRSGHLGLFLEHPHYLPGAYILLRSADDLQFYRAERILTFDDLSPEGIETIVYGSLSLSAEVRDREGLVAHASTIRELDLETELQFMDAEQALAWRAIAPLIAPSGDHSGEEGEEEGEEGEEKWRLCRLSLRCEQRPTDACRLKLRRDQLDTLGLPIVELNWQVSEEDHQSYQRTLALIGAELGYAGIGRLFTPIADDEARRYAPGVPTGGWHHMGTTRMSATPEEGVVNAQCRVHGVQNLYIAGSSVFATGGYVNPTLTIVALAHRLSAHLIEELT